ESPVREVRRGPARLALLPAAPLLPRPERRAAQRDAGEFVRAARSRDRGAGEDAEGRRPGGRGGGFRGGAVGAARECRRRPRDGAEAGPGEASRTALPAAGY